MKMISKTLYLKVFFYFLNKYNNISEFQGEQNYGYGN